MQVKNYRKRSIDIRQKARSNLMEIREARLAKRARNIESLKGNPPSAEALKFATSAVERSFPAGDDGNKDYATEPTLDCNAESLEVRDAMGTSRGDITDQLAFENASIAVEPEALEEQNASTPENIVRRCSRETDVQDGAQSDLAALPGAGVGLIWMMEQCEISTLQDLARQNADELALRLGVVGEIIDVGQWIAFAQAETQRESTRESC
ncbi:hypothetical protein SLH49_10805 [Cognatiyoonia sp. IB215446]|uniref:hypothetical protein n=1 Tax=Cognatiyoonia sp. IB215446 TaxID=3097355 RepID=UPI002A15E956|nr:hypothetical protein [Cognatiyoonia sp. IB215446]MDX8348476.1 hypothetical protein [Cognatiyoonia sp. IB215446]